MADVKAEAIEQARRIDLLTYLSCCEPGNLVHISGNNYCTREHDSLKNQQWKMVLVFQRNRWCKRIRLFDEGQRIFPAGSSGINRWS